MLSGINPQKQIKFEWFVPNFVQTCQNFATQRDVYKNKSKKIKKL